MNKKVLLTSILLMGILVSEVKAQEKETILDAPVCKVKDIKTVAKSMNFLIMGDWGRHGEPHQRKVAEMMSNATICTNATFNIITGDNFYPNGVVSEFDPSWKSSFEDVYTQHPLYDDWYVALGNHDYRTNPDAEIAYGKISSRWHMPARYYSFVKKLKDGTTAEFFIIDTSPFQTDYYKNDDYASHVKGVDTAAQKVWLEAALQKSTATWKFVAGHHPLFSSGGRKEKTADMLNSFGPLFEKYKVDAYLCGHEHFLEFDQPAGYHFVQVISGAGGEASPVGKADFTKFAAQDFGFVAASLTAKSMLLQYINEKGEVIYTTEVKK